MSVVHFLEHITGTDSQQTWFYMWWSGIATQASLLGAIVLGYRHKNCHHRWCLRLGHLDPATNRPLCVKHSQRKEN